MYLYQMVYLLEACLRMDVYVTRDIQSCKNIYALAIVQNYVNVVLKRAGVYGPVALVRGVHDMLSHVVPGKWESCFSAELTETLLKVEDLAATHQDVSDNLCWELVHALKSIDATNKPNKDNAIYFVTNTKDACYVDIEKGANKKD